MYLSKLKIVNFRNYLGTSFDLKEGTNTIIGENDSGKSNAITALRILLDDRYYYSQKLIKESDFNRSLDDWRGHWIIITSEFSGMTTEETKREIVSSIVSDTEIEESFNELNLKISHDSVENGCVSVIIRPSEKIRHDLYSASGDKEKFELIRQSISLSDYEFLYRSKLLIDFSDMDNYKKIVGDFDNYSAPDPSELQSNLQVIGEKLDIKDIHDYVSVVYIDAMRNVVELMNKSNNPIKTIVQSIESQIDKSEIEQVREKIKDLNASISGIDQIKGVQGSLNGKLVDILGLVYSPGLSLASNISDELTSLSKFLNLNPENENSMNYLGLGHLNMIFIALKIVEYNVSSSREILNIMLIEEPEAHIHHHIQKTLFRNLGIQDKATQIIMTTHSPNIAESSEISRMNIVKSLNGISVAMQPSKSLDEFGDNNLKIKVPLTQSIERYLDAKRSAMLFSKGVILVEGDAEEIILPNLIRKTLGVSLDEIGVSIVNIGSTAFQYIAPLFSDQRIKRYCAIVTDADKQAVANNSHFYKAGAEKKGSQRKEKLDEYFSKNPWVESFYTETTFEIELAKSGENIAIYKDLVKEFYSKQSTIEEWNDKLSSDDEETRNEVILGLAEKFGKGWLAISASRVISQMEVSKITVPDYIIEALLFASSESINRSFVEKMILKFDKTVKNIDDFLKPENGHSEKLPALFDFVSKWQDRELM